MLRPRLLALPLALALAPAAVPQPPALVAPTEARTPDEEKKRFRLPPGFEAQLVASEPDIAKPMNLAFDARGRLWVTASVEYPYAAPAGREPRDAVYVLDQFGPDGKAARIEKFVGGLNIPIGLFPHGDGALVYSIPTIDDVRPGGKRTPLYGTFGFRDTHGMTNSFTHGFDGWLYACHGYANDSVVKGRDGHEVRMNSGNVYRMRIDGSHCEYHTHGQVNPFGMCLDPLGNLYTADCHSKPITQLLRGAWYSSFSKPHDGLGFGPNMMGHIHDSTGLCGLAWYDADHFPPEYRGTMFVGNVVTSRVNLDKVEFVGSSPRAVERPDFLVSDDPWFRPVYVTLGPDGALYVADFYNRIIGHYEVPLTHPGRDRTRGRIWRIVYKGADGKAPPPKSPIDDFTKAGIDELVAALAHPNLTVRMTATHELVERGDAAKAPVKAVLAPSAKPAQRMHGMWVLERLGALDDAALAALASDAEAGVRVHAARVLAERAELKDAQAGRLIQMLDDPDALVVRCAADALGRQKCRPESIRALVALRKRVPPQDTHLLHVVRMALRDQYQKMTEAEAQAQLPGDDWQIVADVALGIPTQGGAKLVAWAIERGGFKPSAELPQQFEHIARYSAEQADLLWKGAETVTGRGPAYQAELMQAVLRGTQARGARPGAPTREFATRLCGELFGKAGAGDVRAGVGLALALKDNELVGQLLKVMDDRKLPEAARAEALAGVAAVDPGHAVMPLARVLAEAAEPVTLRERAAQALAALNRPEANAELLKALPTAPARLATAIAGGLAGTPAGAGQLLDAVAAGKASARLLQEQAVVQRLRQSRPPKLAERLAELTKGLPAADQRVAELIGQRRAAFLAAKPDAALGEKVFTQHCANCHQLGGKGTKAGPQLDGVGGRGVDRLLEDLLDSNRNVDAAFRATRLDLADGRVVTGLVLREEGQVIVLADPQGKEVRVEKGQVESRTVTTLSPMPANFDQQVPERDFVNLLAFLLKQKPADAKPGAGGER